MKPIKWSDERIELELRELLAARDSWPSYGKFVLAGRRALRDAVTRHGGAEEWAARMGVRHLPRGSYRATDEGKRPRLVERRRRWTDERIERAVGPLLAQLGRWPTKGEFRKAGLGPALAAIYQHGGPEHWRRRLGATARNQHGPIPDRRRWTDELIERELRAFCAQHDGWPGWQEFERGGRIGLYRAASRHGGIERWKRALGLVPKTPDQPPRLGGRPPPHPTAWTEARVASERRRFLDGRTDWPAWSDFVAAGRQPLREAASRFGDARYWAQRVGVRYVERRGREPWTESRLRMELEPFLAGRRSWPPGASSRPRGRSGCGTPSASWADRTGGLANSASRYPAFSPERSETRTVGRYHR